MPAWIREGLEKMDREKQKKLEKERLEKQRAEMANEDTDNMVEEEGEGPRVPRKSKFVSILYRSHSTLRRRIPEVTADSYSHMTSPDVLYYTVRDYLFK